MKGGMLQDAGVPATPRHLLDEDVDGDELLKLDDAGTIDLRGLAGTRRALLAGKERAWGARLHVRLKDFRLPILTKTNP
jgi:hypothetical protein